MLDLRNKTKELVIGTSFLSTGGGGSPKEAQEIYQKLVRTKRKLPLINVEDLKNEAVCITAFAVGSITAAKGDSSIPIQNAFQLLSAHLNKEIQAVIPVEIGPKSVAIAFELASFLDIPVVDADIVGGRSTPEVFLETITLFDIPRTPIAIASNTGDVALLAKSSSFENEERFMRNFAAMCGNIAYVIGYPLTKQQIETTVEKGTIKQSLQMGELSRDNDFEKILERYNGKVLFEGTVQKIEEMETQGFSSKNIIVKNEKDEARVFIKNENLILWINDDVVLTCPDLIILLDENERPLYNTELKEGQGVRIIGMPARPLWKTEKGVKLFNPRTFGFDLDPKLL